MMVNNYQQLPVRLRRQSAPVRFIIDHCSLDSVSCQSWVGGGAGSGSGDWRGVVGVVYACTSMPRHNCQLTDHKSKRQQRYPLSPDGYRVDWASGLATYTEHTRRNDAIVHTHARISSRTQTPLHVRASIEHISINRQHSISKIGSTPSTSKSTPPHRSLNKVRTSDRARDAFRLKLRPQVTRRAAPYSTSSWARP